VYAGEAAIALDRVQYAAGRGHPARHLDGLGEFFEADAPC
jgi:hypothetical protein